ncbi:MAG TPA: hypothetical protein VNJ70_20685 [Thermoanaerobaculia bacterium]|nr:hypothetical protein [Thermoanaerobaculia bacterium]
MTHRTRRFRLAAAAAVALSLPPTAAALDRAFFWQFEELVSRKPFLRWFWVWDQRAYPLDEIPAGALQRGVAETEAFAATQAAGADSPLQWTAIGPSPVLGGQIGRTGGTREMAGRMTDIAIHPTDPNRWLVGGAHGGIWETRDAGSTWSSLTDDQPSLATGSIAIAASDPQVIYVGTGEAAFSADAYDGAGLLKSTDGGATWSVLATATFAEASFSDVKVDPANADVLVAATSRGIAGRGPTNPQRPPRGLFRSTDGGATWSPRLVGAMVSATDIEPDPTSFNRMYAGIGEIFGDPSNGVYRSLDGGVTWTRIEGLLVPWQNPPFAQRGVGRVELAIAPSQPATLYVSIQDAINGVPNDAGLLGLWRTDNAWDPEPLWVQVPTGLTDNGTGVFGYCGWNRAFASPSGQCWYDHELSVDPANPGILYAGGIELWKLDGVLWTDVSQTLENPQGGIHVDQHTMAWAGNRLVVGNDGGVWSTTDGGVTWNDHNIGLNTIQYYDGSAHPASLIALAGSQDNGSHLWTGIPEWDWIAGGDGADNAISATDPNNDWAVSSQFLNISRTTNGGASFTAANSGIDATNAPFIARFESCPANPNVMIAGTDNLWRSNDFFDGGASWTANGPEEGATRANQITAMAFAPADDTCSTYAYGNGSGVLRLTIDGGKNWRDLDPAAAVPGRFVTDLAFDPTNTAILYVTLSGFDEGTPGQPGHLFKTTSALAEPPLWSNVSPPVNLPANSIAVNPSSPSTLYVGGDVGVWLSTDGGATWAHSGPPDGMPNVAVFEVQTDATGAKIFAFTHGRGALSSIGVDALMAVRPLPASVASPGGDGDVFVDNCDVATASFEVENLGAADLTAVEAVRIEPVSHPETQVLTAVPLRVADLLPCGQLCGNPVSKATATFSFRAQGLAFDDELVFEIEVRALAGGTPISALATLRIGGSESDFEAQAGRTFDFEQDLEGWKVARGTFTRGSPGAEGTATHLASSSLQANQCDEVRSPEVRLGPISTLSLFNQFSTEPGTPALGFYDRANVGLHDVIAGERTTAVPDGGRLYDASGPNGTCVTSGERGWSGVGVPFAASSWSANALAAAGLAGRRLRLSIGYGTDPNFEGTGFQFDRVTLSDFELQVPDARSDVCVIEPCREIDDADPAVEYVGGWHRRTGGGSNGGYHRRLVGGNGKEATARVVFSGGVVTYSYVRSERGGTADIFIDGVLRETLSYGPNLSGAENPTFGHQRTYSGLGPGPHELRIVARTGAVYVDGFAFNCVEPAAGADPTAAASGSETQVTTATAAEGALISRSVVVGAADQEISVVVEGSLVPLTVRLIGPAGSLLATGGSLLGGATSGLDAPVSAPGTYTVQIVNTPGAFGTIEISVARTVRRE